MNTIHVDESLRALATSGSRRRVLRLLGGSLMAGLLARRAAEPALAAQSGLTCAPGREWCYDICADPLTDRKNCGACGSVCEFYEACDNGTCVTLAVLPAPTWPVGPPLEAG